MRIQKAYIYIFLATFIISSMEIAGRILAASTNPTQVNFWRFLVGGLILIPLARRSMKKRNVHLKAGDWAYLVASGFVGVAVSMELFQIALVSTKASTVAVVISSTPVWVIPISCLFLKEVFTKNTAFALLFGILGLVGILDPFHLDPEARGIAITIFAAITFGAYNVMGKSRSDRFGGITFTCFSLLCGAGLLGLMIAGSYLLPKPEAGSMFASFWHIPVFAGITRDNILALIYFGVIGTGGLYAFLFLAMEETSATVGSVVFFFKPVLAPVFAWIILGEHIAEHTYFGIALLLCGTFFVFRLAGELRRRAVDAADPGPAPHAAAGLQPVPVRVHRP